MRSFAINRLHSAEDGAPVGALGATRRRPAGGVGGWLAKIETCPVSGGLTLDERCFPHGEEFRGLRVHQVRLQGGDACRTPTATPDPLAVAARPLHPSDQGSR